MKLVKTINLTKEEREVLENLKDFLNDLDTILFEHDEFDKQEFIRIGEFLTQVLYGSVEEIYKRCDL